MSFRAATGAEAAAIAAFLRLYLDQAMFPLSNLTHHGMGRDGRYQMRFWLREGGGRIVAVLGLSAMGMVLPVLPGQGEGDLRPLRDMLAGEAVEGIIGPVDWAAPLQSALGLTSAPVDHRADEPGFVLDLANLILPAAQSLTLAPLTDAHRPLALDWRARYREEVMGTPPARSRAIAAGDIDTYIARDSHRLLLCDGTPVAMTGFNAELPEAVQVGGVYTPPGMRGRGYARAAVALHLDQARQTGIPRAVLFAASDAAARAYTAIGFRPAGRMAMIFFAPGTRIA